MSSKNVSSNVVSVDERAFEQTNDSAVDESEFEAVDDTPEFRAGVEQETQAKVDSNHPDGIVQDYSHLTLAQEERIKAREAELDRISAKAEFGKQDGRERRTRKAAATGSSKRRSEFQRRRASVEPMADPDRPDPRVELTQEQLAEVNKQSMRLAERVDGWSRAAISRWLAEEVVMGRELTSAVVEVLEELLTAPGRVVPIGKLEEVGREKVSIEGRVETLWEPASPAIAQVGLLKDETGTTKVTIWKASDAPMIEEGERVRIHGAARNWYNGRVSLAVTGWTTIHFPERGRWWDA